MNILCLFSAFFPVILGIVEIIRNIMFKIFYDKKAGPSKTIKIPIYGHCENIEFIVRRLVFKYSWIVEVPKFQIEIIDNGADEETLKICKYLEKNIYSVSLIHISNFNS